MFFPSVGLYLYDQRNGILFCAIAFSSADQSYRPIRARPLRPPSNLHQTTAFNSPLVTANSSRRILDRLYQDPSVRTVAECILKISETVSASYLGSPPLDVILFPSSRTRSSGHRIESIAQPLLLKVVKLGGLEDVEKLPIARAAAKDDLSLGVVRWLVVDWDYVEFSEETLEKEEDPFAESLRVLETTSSVTIANTGKRNLAYLMSMTSSHLTYLHRSSSYFEPTSSPHLPSLNSLTLYGVSFDLFRSLVNSSIVPSLRNFAFVYRSEEGVRWLKEPSITRFLLRLETLHLDGYLWLNLDTSFRRSIASRTLVDVDVEDLRRAGTSETSLTHARSNGMSIHTINMYKIDPETANKMNDYASVIRNSSSMSLQSFYLDSSFQFPSNLSAPMQLAINNLAKICQERKIDLVFDQVSINYDLDPLMSAEFIRRQEDSRRSTLGGYGKTTGYSS
ncbi:hypothetical protein JCM5350_002321 [Sporobolomyces pararoseus]